VSLQRAGEELIVTQLRDGGDKLYHRQCHQAACARIRQLEIVITFSHIWRIKSKAVAVGVVRACLANERISPSNQKYYRHLIASRVGARGDASGEIKAGGIEAK